MEKIKNVFQSLKTWHKMVIGAAILAIGTGALLYFTLPDKYVVVYQNLNDADKQEITAELSKLGVDYQLVNDGAIKVPTKDAPWIRKEMNGMGLPFNSKSGEEILLESSLGSSEQDKKMKQLVGTKKQLEQDIVRNFATIESANVQITLPEKETIFDEEKAKGTAAITVGVKRGQLLTEDQVAGIQQMISAAVSGVKPEEVSVIDSKKGIVSKGADASTHASSSSYEKEVEMQQQIENKLKQDIDATLMTMFKANEFKVNTKVSVNYDEVTRQSEKYGDKGVLRSRQDQQERSTAQEGADAKQGAGITANGEVPNYGTNNNQNGKVVYDNNNGNKIENYEIDKTVETIKKHPELTKTNVVVWVDNDTLTKRRIDMTTFKEAIGTAAGLQIDPNGEFTNGQVNVVTVQFDQQKEEKTKEPEPNGFNWWLIGGIAGGLLALGGLVWYLLARRKRKQEEIEEYESLAEEEVAATDETIMEIPEEKLEPTEQAEPTEPTLDEQVQDAAKEHVEGTAKVIKKWLNGQ
ncbi:flagellar basal-body MS-ring/collar protein FliF [Bacillus cytotoxicus]|uniref:Flagellar M-ring protein FliF n=1 Tax=Bacillus cytotoxicus (strain DSM 22905 / CIP 110041 / 391-98 / NVH 391-98) TaxID=315749 RepID=A7GNH2_BACCN|nr:flagellar basal-body MS-ring/collar protein FliF [Bacillus cytotoxicus]ABS21680.1 flagellar M-ring protein FliF [Bacillus cytotoxicus NVH 391-98]AWC44378.1 flagellar basal body M-ring protein FliF [Bacillus cytotoxicus]MDH2863043.1 flagellar M-ring protein FliF [Bacillus cytotoxicus]MDH2883028.1 flagellar M-ring protein FliF [Bacillus cytotoxicus]MDH2886976.1 flagellar M-ring protein FliF [Bacillus cytotoxicus]